MAAGVSGGVGPGEAARRLLLVLLLTVLVSFASGCTSMLWSKETFAHHYQPAYPNNLRLFYSETRKDILAEYEETKDGSQRTRQRCYWVEVNATRGNQGRRPRFVSEKASRGLAPVFMGENALSGAGDLWVEMPPYDDYFILYSGKEELNRFGLPSYSGSSRRVKQVVLTPFSVAVDATLIGALISFQAAPGFFASASR